MSRMKTVSRYDILSEAYFIVTKRATLRAAQERFGRSKTAIHKDMTIELPEINALLYKKVKAVFDKNIAERHIRGGMATKLKYQCEH